MTGSTAGLLDAAFTHLARLSDDTGLFEHARYATPRREHGYCLDDVARGLVVLCRQPPPWHLAGSSDPLAERYLAFVVHAQSSDGRFRNRLGFDRRWQDEPGLGDWWGRALWALGTAAARSPLPWVREHAMYAFDASVQQRSPWPRSMAFAALGAAEILAARPAHQGAIDLLIDAAKMIQRPEPGSAWPWPEDRLGYANAALPEVLIAAGQLLLDAEAGYHGLELLEWLLATESGPGHLSPTGSQGWHAGEPRPGFDQQPLEAAALADACARAFEASGDARWIAGVERAVGWFLGENDRQVALHDPGSGGGYDGLHPQGHSVNQGAESTLALISTLQQGIRIAGRR
ncbi:glycosyltransferase [Actinocrinis sp.]|uniref:glycosyltransferase n=1 Tax=Actinocrinis sp. TaxID=1920516 RepID=UPI002D5CFA31|nr:glycosyltransferase [Actinocrinis sp.]HZP49626.1 glycosyltransferase [Actinocrinis sp.]